MATAQLTFELTKKQHQELVQQYISQASPEEIHWLFKTITTQRRNDLNHLDMVRKYAKIVSVECLLPRNALANYLAPL